MFGLRLLHRARPPWYRWLEERLEPLQGAVVVLLLLVIGVSVYLIVRGPNWARTVWLVYLLSP